MSGGSFNYLHQKTAMGDLGASYQYQKAADALREEGHALAAEEVGKVVHHLDQAFQQAEKVEPLLRAIEWKRSGDTGPEDLSLAVRTYLLNSVTIEVVGKS